MTVINMTEEEIQKDLKQAEKMMAYAEKIKEPLMYKAWAIARSDSKIIRDATWHFYF